MTIQTYPDLRDSLADNNVGAITAQNIVNLLDSVSADSAVLEDTTGSTQTANVTTFSPMQLVVAVQLQARIKTY